LYPSIREGSTGTCTLYPSVYERCRDGHGSRASQWPCTFCRPCAARDHKRPVAVAVLPSAKDGRCEPEGTGVTLSQYRVSRLAKQDFAEGQGRLAAWVWTLNTAYACKTPPAAVVWLFRCAPSADFSRMLPQSKDTRYTSPCILWEAKDTRYTSRCILGLTFLLWGQEYMEEWSKVSEVRHH
jgi:hypothetical protein